MQQNNKNFYWIIMADIINSSELNGLFLQKEFKNIIELANKKYQKKLVSPLTITLGDECQGVVNNLLNSLKIILLVEESILLQNLGFRLRWVVNYGKIDTNINKEIAYGMLGSGLTEARENLNNLKKTDLRFQINTTKLPKNEALDNSFVIFDNIISKWNKQEDRALVACFLKYIDYKKVAEILNKDRSQIWRRRNTLEINPYFAIKNLIQYLA